MIGPQFLAAPLGTPGFPRTAAYVSRAQRRALRAISGKRTTIPRACAGVCTVSIRWAEKGDAISTLLSTGDYTAGRKSRANSARIRCRSRSRSASRASVPSSIALTPNMNTTDRIGDAGHAHALHRGACHRPSMWQAGSAGGKGCPLLSRACEERGWGPLGPVRPAYISDAP